MTTDTIISGCAFVLAFYGILSTRRQNRLSVRPHIVGNRHLDWSEAGFCFSYDLSNHGFGPARLKKFVLLLDDQPFNCSENKNLIEEFFAKRLAGKVDYQILKSGKPNKDYCILANQSYRIVEILIPGAKRSDENQLGEILKGLDLRVEYESFYNERFAFDTRDKS